jgi:hypothetical protein
MRWRQHENPDLWQESLPLAMDSLFSPLLARFSALNHPVQHAGTAQQRVDTLYRLFERTFTNVCFGVVGTKLASNRCHAWWKQPGVAQLYRNVTAARRVLQATPLTAPNRPALRAALNQHRAALRRAIQDAKQAAWADLCDSIQQKDSKKRWQAVHRTDPSPFSPLNSIPDAAGHLPHDLTASLDNLAAAFVSEATPPPAPIPVTVQRYADVLSWTHPTQSTLPPHASDTWTFSPSMVRNQCRYQHIQSAPGPDCILPAFLRYAGRTVHIILSLFYNFSWRHAVLPQAWTEANVMALYKGAAAAARGKPAGCRAQASSYRPISMTSIVIRTFEHLIHRRLSADLEQRGFFHPQQFGFRTGRTTADAINSLLSIIRRTNQREYRYTDDQGISRRHQMPCPVLFLDIKKAFDRVWPEQLLRCLVDAGITGRAWHWIRSFLSHRRIRTTQLDTCSNWHHIGFGVPQGCVLSPFLFLVYINPVLDQLSANCPRICPLAFADDGVLAPAIIERNPYRIALQRHRQRLPATAPVERAFDLDRYLTDLSKALTILDAWCNTARVRFGADKTQLVVFCGAQNLDDALHPRLASFRLCGFTISIATSYVYLGVTLHQKLSWLPHATRALAVARRESQRITRLIRGATTNHFAATRSLVLGLLLPSFAYGIAFWGRDLTATALARFDTALAQPLRRLLHLPPTTCKLGVLTESNCPSTAAWTTRELLLLYHRLCSLPYHNPAREVHELDLRQHSDKPHLALETTKTITTSRYVQLLCLPRATAKLRPYLEQHAPQADKMRNALLPLPYLPDPTFDYLEDLDTQQGTQRRIHLQSKLSADRLQLATQWAADAIARLSPDTIRRLTPWLTHQEWQPPDRRPHQSEAPLVACLPYPRRSLYLSIDPPSTMTLRARLRARRALTEEHRHRLEKPAIGPACSPYCTYPGCQQQQPQQHAGTLPVDSVEHILLYCPRHAQIRNSLLTAIRAASSIPSATLSVPLLLGEVTDLPLPPGGRRARHNSLLHLTATYYRDVDGQRQRDALRPFEPP